MKAVIKKSFAKGKVVCPPSKSLAHRALICGAFSERSVIKNVAFSDDINATLGCLEALGANIEKYEDHVIIGGLNVAAVRNGTELYCNESGSTFRFLIPICMLTDKNVVFHGKQRLFERPLDIYFDIAEKQGIVFEKTADSLTVGGTLASGEYYVRGDVSSQFITGLLYALSLLENDSKIIVTGKFESASYIDLTLQAMALFGVDVVREQNVFYIKGGQKYRSAEYTVEGDCSNAAFLECFNYADGDVDVCGVSLDTAQGDRVYKQMFDDLRCGKKEFDLSDCPDLAPIMFVMASMFGGAVFNGTSRLKIKESDRASCMAKELAKFGIKVDVFENSVVINNGKPTYPKEELCSHNDHRIVMALAFMCSVVGGVIDGCEAVKKSFPDYFEKIKGLGINVELVK